MIDHMPMAPLVIPDHEIEFRATRAGGPGGQHVNTSSTRVELWWNVATTSALDPGERDRVIARLGGRVDAEGWLRVVAADSRSQHRNRTTALERMIELVEKARLVPKTRRPTKVPRAAREKRLQAKRLRSGVKRDRRRPLKDD